MRQIELLSPAKNLEFGKAAINCGADAVYMGSPKFGARLAAGNSISDIASLVNYAHKFKSKVYIALNTLLFDNELTEAYSLIKQIWKAGADALIVQDMGICEMDLPPIPLFASTQTHNADYKKVLFFEKIGFQRVILARELSFSEISEIRKNTSIELECFIHGAICVCYSGQCYLSQALIGRSGNRGDCAQPCRWKFSLKNSANDTKLSNKYSLSLKDLNLSEHLEELIHSGITSFKIEGRLKDIAYVKNVTGFYRQKLDAIIEEKHGEFSRSSIGKTIYNFNPDLDITFNRGYSNYFAKGRQKNLASFATQKSIGKYIGQVQEINKNNLVIETEYELSNGDGLCFINKNAELDGFRVNIANGNRIFPNEMPQLKIGTKIFRNHNQQFESNLEKRNMVRKINLIIELTEYTDGLKIKATDEENIFAEIEFKIHMAEAKDAAASMENLRKGLTKTGNTIYNVKEVNIATSKPFFLPNSKINEMKRQLIEAIDKERESKFKRNELKLQNNNSPYPDKTIDFRGNVTNKFAENFYKKHGANVIEAGFEMLKNASEKRLMTTKYCLRYEMNACPKNDKNIDKFWNSEVFLENSETLLHLGFDCKNCVMHIKKV